jgi:tetratricopeptide (TPR) repeat protein
MVSEKIKLFILLIFLSAAELKADFRSEIYSAYINNKMEMWKNVIDKIESIRDKDDDLLLELVNYQYGYIGYCLGFNKLEEAKKYLNLYLKNINILAKTSSNLSIVNAYKSAFYGFRISLNKLSAPLNGPKSLDHSKQAMELDKENFLGYVQYGNSQFYLPAAFGGSKKDALKYFLKAKSILEKKPEETRGDWNYMSLLILVGQTYSYLGDYSSAKVTFEFILKLEPEFIYVKDDLYPKLLKKMKT